MPLVRPGNPREAVSQMAAEMPAPCLVIGSHRQRQGFDLGGTLEAIGWHTGAGVIIASADQ